MLNGYKYLLERGKAQRNSSMPSVPDSIRFKAPAEPVLRRKLAGSIRKSDSRKRLHGNKAPSLPIPNSALLQGP